MIISVVSKDNVVLYARVQAKNEFQRRLSEQELRAVAAIRTAEDLRGDDYDLTADLAATVRRPAFPTFGATYPTV